MSKATYVLYGVLPSTLYAKNYSQFLTRQISVHVSRPVWQETLNTLHQTYWESDSNISSYSDIYSFISQLPPERLITFGLSTYLVSFHRFFSFRLCQEPPTSTNQYSWASTCNLGPIYSVIGPTPSWFFRCLIQVSNTTYPHVVFTSRSSLTCHHYEVKH